MLHGLVLGGVSAAVLATGLVDARGCDFRRTAVDRRTCASAERGDIPVSIALDQLYGARAMNVRIRATAETTLQPWQSSHFLLLH
jgi:hypothetical protein